MNNFEMRRIMLGLLLAGITMSTGICRASENNSLANLHSGQQLREMLLPYDQWRPFPKAGSRAEWQALPESARKILAELGDKSLAEQVPPLPATLYLEYKRVGNRSRYQDVWLERRDMLHAMVIAECIEGRGRYLDAIANVIWAICEESSWTWPAHIAAQKAGVGLPDTSEPIVALFSAETGASLAWTKYLLEDQLDDVSPRICERIEREIDKRILAPCLERKDFGWMGFRDRADGRRPNNWNPWINSNVLTAGLLIEKDDGRRVELVQKVLRCLDNFFVPYPPDGSCDEGPSYWGHAGACLFDNLELLYSATRGRFDVYDWDGVRQIGRFIYRAHICDDYFVDIGDCYGRFEIPRDLTYRYGLRIGDPHMQTLARYGVTVDDLLTGERSLFSLGRLLHTLFDMNEFMAFKAKSQPLLRDVWLGHEDMELMAARDEQGSRKGLYVACWGGHNGQSHNHNDVGNFIVYGNGRPFIIDAGKPTYTRQTFSSGRYQIWTMQSAYHSLPTINGVMQQAGRQYAAKHVQYSENNGRAQLTMDIAGAYPSEAGLSSWRRTVRLNRRKSVEVEDSFKLAAGSDDIVMNLLTPCNVKGGDSGELYLTDPQSGTRMLVLFDGDKLQAQIEPLEMDDELLSSVWGPRLQRILLHSRRSVQQDRWIMRFSIIKSDETK